MFLIKFEMFLNVLRNTQNLFLLERQTDNLNTDRHPLSILNILPDQLSARILPIALIMQLIFPGDSNRLRHCCHSENIEQVCVSSHERPLF